MVVMEKQADGSYLVYRVLPCLPSAQAAAQALERVVPDAFKADTQ